MASPTSPAGPPAGRRPGAALAFLLGVLSAAGCGRAPPTAPALRPLDGEWQVTSLNGEPLAAGAEVTVTYHGECGCTEVNAHGNEALATALDSNKLKPLFDQYRGAPPPSRAEVRLAEGSFEVRLRRTGPVRQRHGHSGAGAPVAGTQTAGNAKPPS